MTGASSGAPAGMQLVGALSDRSPRRLRRGTRLYHEGDAADDAYFVNSGLVKMVKTAGGGFQSVIALRGAGDFVGEHSAIDGLPRLTSAVAVTDTSVTAIDRDRLVQAIREDHDFALELLCTFSGHLRTAAQYLLELAAGDAVALVAWRLTQLASDPMFESIRETRDENMIIEMPVSQQELASWAGVSHRSAAAALRRLRDDGLITTARLNLEVHDRAALADRAVGTSPSLPSPSPTA